MRILLNVVGGPLAGSRFSFGEPDCFLIGRDARGSRAHLRLEGKDPYVSRNHFLLEIRPPYCYIRDNQSRNGTFVKPSGSLRFRQVSSACLGDGDLIRVGQTVLELRVDVDGEPPGPASSPESCSCMRCGREVRMEPLKVEGYVCESCRAAMESRAASTPAQSQSFSCVGCGADLSAPANRDGRAAELAEVATYLCDSCAVSARRETEIAEIRDYLLLEERGRGAMGVVYKAWHAPTRRLVALKRLLPQAEMDDKAIRLFQREISVMRDIVHPGIVRLFDHGMFEGSHYLVCELLHGGNVDDLLASRTGPLDAASCSACVCQILRALEYAHGKGYVHRDVKPRNILLQPRAEGGSDAKVSDFGLAKSFQNAGQSGITKVGESSGTIFFMAPEQITNYRFVKPPADTYSVGVSLYYMLTAKYQFDFPSPMEQIRGLLKGRQQKDPVLIILEDKPIPVRERRPDVPRGIAEVVDRAVRRQEQKRYQTAAEMREALERAGGE